MRVDDNVADVDITAPAVQFRSHNPGLCAEVVWYGREHRDAACGTDGTDVAHSEVVDKGTFQEVEEGDIETDGAVWSLCAEAGEQRGER